LNGSTDLTTSAVDVSKFLWDKVGFEPHPEQETVLRCGKRFILVAGGDQSGKSVTGSKYLLQRFSEPDEPGLYWLVGQDYSQTQREFFYMKDDFIQLGFLRKSSTRVDPGYMELHYGTRIVTKSAKDPRTLSRDAPDGIMACEASLLDVTTFERMRARCSPKRGWLFMSGSLESSVGWYPQLLEAWRHGFDDRQSFSLPTPSNVHLYPNGLDEPEMQRLKAESSDAFWEERIMGRRVPPRGLVFHEFRVDIHVQDIEWAPGEAVHLWEDPGYGSDSAHAIHAVQIINGQIRVFDEIYERNLITEDIIDICKGKDWWKDVRWLVSDPSYKDQHHSMNSVGEQWLKSTGLFATGTKVRINEGTERLKGFLKPDSINGVPKIVYSPRCTGVLSEFGAAPNPFDGQTRAYRWKTDRDGNIVGNIPEDKWNHAVKADIYGIVDNYGYGHVRSGDKIRVKRW